MSFSMAGESKALHMLENRDLMKTLKEHKESMEL
jgi:hypothetical protein